MPIGFARESGRPPAQGQRPAARPSWSERVIALAQTVTANVAGVEPSNRALHPTFWTRWQTASDERVCPVCGPYAGRAWPADEGPAPPLHPHCRCRRVYAFTTWSVREG